MFITNCSTHARYNSEMDAYEKKNEALLLSTATKKIIIVVLTLYIARIINFLQNVWNNHNYND